MLPIWMQWAQAIALIIIPLVGAWIAFRQAQLARAKLKFDLYDRRFKVFEAARQFLIDVVQSDHVDAGRVIKFNVDTADAVFLFKREVEAYLDLLRERILKLRRLKSQEKAAEEYGEEEKRIKLGELAANQHLELSGELSTLIDTFKPYLRLDNI